MSSKKGRKSAPYVVENDGAQMSSGYNVQDTVTSKASMESTDASWLDETGFKGGVVEFTYNESTRDVTNEHLPEGSAGYYVSVPSCADADDIAMYMAKKWKKCTPNIIVTLLTSHHYYQPWKNSKQVEDFQHGLVQAVNATEMWLLTNGLDGGITKIVGDAIREERYKRLFPLSKFSLKFIGFKDPKPPPKLSVIGILPENYLSYSSVTHDETGNMKIGNQGNKPFSSPKELNPDHTHYIMLSGIKNMHEMHQTRVKMEERFLSPVGRPKKYRKLSDFSDSSLNINKDLPQSPIIHSTKTPMVGLLVQGGPLEIDHVLDLVKRKVPVVVVKGTGLAADIIAFCCQEHTEDHRQEHIESYLKPELILRLAKYFPDDFRENEVDRSRYRDKLLEIAELAEQENLKFITILEIDGIASDLKNLDKYILMALFESQTITKGRKFQEQFLSDIKLTLDWNRCDLAASQIFHKYESARLKISADIFDTALMKEGGEEFVQLFLEKNCILVHKYLNHNKLLYLFNNNPNKEFFATVCMNGVLSKYFQYPAGKEFVVGDECDLNVMLYKLTMLKNLVSSYELSMNCMGTYVTDKFVAERRAINTLVYWSALTFNPKLTKVLWYHCEDPMAMAIIVSMIWNRLAKHYCVDLDFKQKLLISAEEFGKLSVKMLDLTSSDSSNLAISALNKSLIDFNDKSTVEIAHMAHNRVFIAHTICQKWLNQRWLGKLQLRNVEAVSIKCPDWVKIYLSVLLFFPTYIWITFDVKKEKESKFEQKTSEDDESEDDETALLTPLTMEEKWKKKYTLRTHVDEFFAYGRQNLKVPIYKQFYYLWTAPITKFWLSQLCYIMFLVVFSTALLVPSCGSVAVDMFLAVWILLIWLEIVRGVITKKRKYMEIDNFWTIVEIFFMGGFLLTFVMIRIMPRFVPYLEYMTTKFVMSVGLLYFYYRMLVVFLPISPVLGPMLFSIKRMVSNDFLVWIRMFLICMISGGITIHATLYPNYPFTFEGIKRALSRAFFALFLTKIDDLEGDEMCSYLYENSTLTTCYSAPGNMFSKNATNSMVRQISKLAKCPHGSIGGYLIVMQYLLLTKLVLITLLYALFSQTQAQVQQESESIWKYQKYSLIVDFEERLRLPPPFSVISYILMIIEFVFRLIYRWITRCCRKGCSSCCRKNQARSDSTKLKVFKAKRSEDYTYWRVCLKNLKEQEELENKDRDRLKIQSKNIEKLITEIAVQKSFNTKLVQQIAFLQRSLASSIQSMELVQHMVSKLDPSNRILEVKDVHTWCRQSPYPGTNVHRFPVYDKYVPWEIVYESYDPEIYTSPTTSFPEDIQAFVDPDLLTMLLEVKEYRMSQEDLQVRSRSHPLYNPLWNVAAGFKISDSYIELDRTSWITKDGERLVYNLDGIGLPINPLGRTGLRGRGSLWRWGPNHSVIIVLSRWKRIKKSKDVDDKNYFMIEGKRVLEVIVIKRKDTGDITLPSGSDFGNISMYSSVCYKFLTNILGDKTQEVDRTMLDEDMVQFFSNYCVPMEGKKSVDILDSSIIYKGYTDDPCNTDNAWKESVVWNLHFPRGSILDGIMKDKDRWREATSYTKLHGNQDMILREAARKHGAFY